MKVTTRFSEWLDVVNPKLDTDYLDLYRVARRGVNCGNYERVEKDGCYYLKTSRCDLMLKLASEKSEYVFIQMLGQRANISNFEDWCQITPRMFKDSDSPEDILQEVIDYGIAGISGGRLGVRALNSLIQKVAEERRVEHIYSATTYNHECTELSYPHDENKYDSEYAKRLVIRTYDEFNPPEYEGT